MHNETSETGKLSQFARFAMMIYQRKKAYIYTDAYQVFQVPSMLQQQAPPE